MNVLIVSYFFPPDKAVGGFRPYSFSQFFPKKGINVFLLTSNSKVCETSIDQDLLAEIRPICAKRPRLREWGYKTKILAFLELFNLDKLLFFPDIYFQWISRAVKKGLNKLQSVNLDAIIATVPPYSSMIVGYKLSKQLHVPLILDYRDPWSGNPFLHFPFSLGKKRVLRTEKKIVNHAKLLVTVGEDYAQLISEQLNLSSDSFKVVYNGFSLDQLPTSFKPKREDKFVISYFGNFYLIQKRVMQTFFDGLAKFIRKNKIDSSQIVFQYSGHTSRKVLHRMMKKAGIIDYFEDLVYLSREKLFEEISQSHLVIDVIPEKTEYMIHTKIYDYASGNSHIFLIGNRGAIVDLCNDIDQKYTLSENNSLEVANKLDTLWKLWKKGELEFGCDKEKLNFYSRRNQAENFASILLEYFQ